MPEARETRKPQGYAGPKNPPKKPRSKASPARLAALDVVRAVNEAAEPVRLGSEAERAKRQTLDELASLRLTEVM